MGGGPLPQSLPALRRGTTCMWKCGTSLTGDDPVVLDQVEPVGVVSAEKGIGNAAYRMYHCLSLLISQVEQRRGVALGDDVDLAQLVLLPVHHGERQARLLNDTLLRAPDDNLAHVAGIAGNRRLAPVRTAGP